MKNNDTIYTLTRVLLAVCRQGGGPYGREVTRGQDLTGKDFSGLDLTGQDFKTVSGSMLHGTNKRRFAWREILT